MEYRGIVTELESRGIMPERAPSLEPTRAVLARMDLAIDPANVVVVAGTNGKGSVCASLEALLGSAGECVGLYTSPHLEETSERIRIGGEDISRELFAASYRAVTAAAGEIPLTHFETITLMAAWCFFAKESPAGVTRAVLEVGMGGTWDATNAIPHATSIITPLSIDHERYLGRTIDEIARNKLGIVAGHAKAIVHAPFPAGAATALAETRARLAAAGLSPRWIESGPVAFTSAWDGPRLAYTALTRWGEAPLALAGPRAVENAALALGAFEAMGYDPGLHLHALARVRWPGRMERFDTSEGVPIYLSGDHNPQGVASLLEMLPAYPRRKLHILFAAAADKDLDGILAPLFGIEGAAIYFTRTPFRGRALDGSAEGYGSWFRHGAGAWADPREALREVSASAIPGEMILVTGSLYLVGAVRPALRPYV